MPQLAKISPASDLHMEDLHRAGGVPVLLKALQPLLHVSAVGVTARPLESLLAEWPAEVRVMSSDSPVAAVGNRAPCS